MTVWVYALLFDEGSIYVGLTSEMSRRMEEHRRRQSRSTRKYKGGFKVLYQQPFHGYAAARTHEKYLKSGSGRQMLKSLRT